MQQLVYASAACEPFSPHSLRALLQQSRARNQVYSVTGMLLYHESCFLQVLEGPGDGVERIYSSIEKDPRHQNPKLLLRKPIEQREFADWSMGFIDTAAWGARPVGMLDYTQLRSQARDHSIPTQARKYLRFFYDGLCRQA